jgi:anaerobic dimethyl sulfoxide reductase subunit A
MTNETLQPPSTGAAVRFPGVNDTAHPDGQGYQRRDFLKIVGASAGAAGLVSAGVSLAPKEATAFPYAPYYTDDQLTTVVTSCAHNCGSRHMLVAHKKGDVIVRLSTDDGATRPAAPIGKDTFEEPQLRACLRGRSYRARLYSPERLLYPMVRVGKRGEGKFKRVSWDEALDTVAKKMVELKKQYGPTALLDQSYAGASYGVLHKSDQIEGLLGRFLGMFGCRTNSWSVPSYQATTFSSRMTFGTIQDGNEDDAFAHSKLIIMWGWNPAYTFHGGNTFYYMRMAKQRGCKFVLVDPQYTDSAASLRRLVDSDQAQHRRGHDGRHGAPHLHQQPAGPEVHRQVLPRHGQGHDAQGIRRQGELQGLHPGHLRQDAQDARVGRADLRRQGRGHPQAGRPVRQDQARSAEGLLGARPGILRRTVQPHGGRLAGHDRQHRRARRLRRGRGQGLACRSVAYPYDENANLWWGSIKSDRWAHCVLNYPNVKREEIGLWPRNDNLDGKIPNIKGIFWQGSDWFNQLTNINKEIKAIEKLELVVCWIRPSRPRASGPTCCCRSPPISSATTCRPALVQGALLHPPAQGDRTLGRIQDRFPGLHRVVLPPGSAGSDPEGLGQALQPACRPQLLPESGRGGRGLPLPLVEQQREKTPARHDVVGGFQEARHLQVSSEGAAYCLP